MDSSDPVSLADALDILGSVAENVAAILRDENSNLSNQAGNALNAAIRLVQHHIKLSGASLE